METLIQALKAINDVIWGPGMLILLIGTGLYLTVGLRFYTFRNIFSAFSMLWKGRTSSAGDKGELTPFNALMTALAGTIGTGSIVGVATAILSGGPGALFWMWCTAMVGMATKFSEILLAVRYREVTRRGISWAGPCTSSRTGSAKNGNGSAACSPFLRQSPVSGPAMRYRPTPFPACSGGPSASRHGSRR